MCLDQYLLHCIRPNYPVMTIGNDDGDNPKLFNYADCKRDNRDLK